MFKFLRSALAWQPYYVKIRKDRLSVIDSGGSGHYEDEPIIVISEDEKPEILAIGKSARSVAGKRVCPFSHPRVLVDDFLAAEKIVQHAFHNVSRSSFIRAAPIAVVHVLEELEGGITPIEERVLRELMISAGARKVYLWKGHELSNEEIKSGIYRESP